MVLAILLIGPARAQDTGEESALPPGANVDCPVMPGEPTKADIFVDYEGVRIYFCCRICQRRFQDRPTSYLAHHPAFADQFDRVERDAEKPGVEDNAGASADSSISPPAPAPTLPMVLGRLHPLVVHFPIALLIVAFLMECVAGLRRRAEPAAGSGVVLTIAALGAIAAAAFGWMNADTRGVAADLQSTLAIHRWTGIAVAGLAVVLLLTHIGARSGRSLPAIRFHRFLLFISAATVMVAGHFGGTLVYGPEYLNDVIAYVRGGSSTADDSARRVAGRGASRESSIVPLGRTTPSEAITAALFAQDFEQLHIARRNVRLGLVDPPPAPPSVDGPAYNDIDRFIIARWAKDGLPEANNPPALCDDATYLRRVYLDVIGVVPTVEEARAFLDSTDPDKRARLVEELLARHDDYAAHWTPFWEDALGSVNVRSQGGIPTRGNYRDWLYRAFRDNRPFDLIAVDLIDPTMPNHQPAVDVNANGKVSKSEFILNETHTDTLQSAAIVGQVFLGTGMKCASCHSHFENEEWPQERFLAFAGYFNEADLEKIRCEAKTGEFVDAAFPFELPQMPASVPTTEEGRRRLVAQLVTDPTNPRFAKTIVNRLWKRYLGYGLFEPIDDFRLDRAPSHPELLEWLAHDFMANGYDLKHTIRRILNSRTYQQAFDAKLVDSFDIANPDEPRYFRSPVLRRLTAEQAIDSIRRATAQRLTDAQRLYRETESTALSRALGKPASRNEISTGRPDDVAVVQALELLNGEEFHALIYRAPIGRLLGEWSAARDADEAIDETIERVYLAAISRLPTEEERSIAADYLRSVWPTSIEAARPEEVIWIDDEPPAGAQITSSWKWITRDDGPVHRGERAHTQRSASETNQQHYVLEARDTLRIGFDDTLFTYVYLDPADPPREVMVQWNDGEWEHRAYWGANEIPFGMDGTTSRHRAGDLPKAGEWVRLEVRADLVGLGARPIVGMSFDQAGGTVYWDTAGAVTRPAHPARAVVGDLLWALFTSPEFQYVR